MSTSCKYSEKELTDVLSGSTLYAQLRAEREEILRHKWIESEKAGCDIGIDRSIMDWIRYHRDEWRAAYYEEKKQCALQTPLDTRD